MDTLGTTTVSAPVRSRKSLSMEREEPIPSASDQGTRSLATQSSGDNPATSSAKAMKAARPKTE